MARGGIISNPKVKKLFEKGDEEKDLLRKFTIDKIFNRLKYE